jgi:hypothetical protein
MAHAIDGPKREYSSSEEWKAIWDEEIGSSPTMEGQKPKLTKYATTSSGEGFAEFGRMVYGMNSKMEIVEKKFPKCVAYWRKMGILE